MDIPKIDVVYVLGSGSPWQDNELRYSLRSVHMYGTGVRNVVIVGRLPTWARNVVHIPCQDRWGSNKEGNIMYKVLMACRTEEVSSNFLFMNDDHFMLDYFEAFDYPYYCMGSLWDRLPDHGVFNVYQQSLYRAMHQLHKSGKAIHNFDMHAPIMYSKSLFEQMARKYEWQCEQPGPVVKSLYANHHGLKPTMLADCKIEKQVSKEYLVNRLKNRPVWSIGDGCLPGPVVKGHLAEIYPDASPWES